MCLDVILQALANAADGVFVVNPDQRIIFWNEAARELLGHAPETVTEKSCWEILEGQDDRGEPVCSGTCQLVMAALAGVPVPNYDTCVRTASGELRWINISTLTLPPLAPQATPLVVHLFRDATRHRRNESFVLQVLGMVERLQASASPSPVITAAATRAGNLTEREGEVLSLLAQGLSTRAIALSLSIRPATTRNHVQNILTKLHAHTRLEAVARALELGLIKNAL
jgi:PAS domain S-box-containing protein